MKRSTVRTAFSIVFLFVLAALVVRGVWIRQAIAREITTLTASDLDFTIEESALQRGIDSHHVQMNWDGPPNVTEWMKSTSANLAVADVNGDGFMDIYVANIAVGSQNQLFINDGTGHFTEQAAQYGLADLNRTHVSMRPIFFDCDEDGSRELMMVTEAGPMIYKRGPEGRYALVDDPRPPFQQSMAEAVSVADVDGDGHLDIVIADVAAVSGSFLPENAVEARNGGALNVWLGDGKCHFRRADGILNAGGKFFFHSLGVGDLRGTGKPDFWLATDFASDKVLLNRGDGHYDLLPPFYSTQRSGMNSEVLYLKGDENPFVFVSHAFHKGYAVGGNSLWQYDGHEFRDHAIPKGLHECGWSWGARGIDLNNDGLLDIAVANGDISGDPKTDYWFPFGTIIGSTEAVMVKPEYWTDMKGWNFSGHERDCLYLNRGDHFENIAKLVDYDHDSLDGRAVAVIDPDNSGHQHLVVVNQNGRLNYYTITPRNHNAWIGFSVESRVGAREALGTRITVTAGGKRFRRENYSTNTYASQSDPRLHFGLGPVSAIDNVEVRWPDGRVQNLGPMAVNQYHHLVEEP